MKQKDAYYEYLCDLALGKDVNYYKKLLQFLHERDFLYILDLDENRAVDGLEMRNEFFKNYHLANDIYYEKSCSILEMMVALAKRCCDGIMDDGSGLDYIGEMFRLMLNNLGLLNIPDTNFNLGMVADIVDNFLDRKYCPDGRGSLFYIPHCSVDLREVEIWTQAMWFLETILN